MSDEFSIDIDKALENAKNTDHIGFDNPKPDGLESVKQAVTNCIDLAGLDKKLMGEIADGEFSSYDCYDSTGRHYTKLVIEYEEPKTR
tara:strand:- start:1066 stop:1329 length:264 start_codon:yes stop_codon:yes gene_type:complete